MKKIAFAVSTAVLLTGCATVFDGGSKTINISPSNGKQVKAQIIGDKNVENVTLPAIYNAKRSKEDLLIKVTDECYEETSYVVQSEITPAFFGNFLFGLFGLTGTTVDNSKGNMWTYDNAVVVPTNKKASCK